MELKILDLIQKLHDPVLDWFMCFITSFGNYGFFWLIVAIVLIIIQKTRRLGVIVLIGLLLNGILCDGILKNMFQRPRPCDVNTAVHMIVPRPYGWSFPSGHASASFTLATAIYCAGKKKAGTALFVFATLIAFSRMYLYVHYPTDVLCGTLLGIFCGYVGKACFDKICKMRKKHV